MAETKPAVRKADMLPAPIVSLVQSLVPDCNVLLPPDITQEQFRAALWLELTGRQALHGCAVESLRECVVKAAQYGMLPGRDCHFLPFGDSRTKSKRATFLPNYQGVLRSLYRTGQVEQAFAEVVYSNDEFDLDYGRTPMLRHKPPRKNRGRGEGAYGVILLRGTSRPIIHYMDEEDLDRVRRRAPAHEQGPWVSDTNEMKRKTAMKNVAKYAQLTPLVQGLLEEDDARLLTDISEARHRENIVALFGDVHGSPMDQSTPEGGPAAAASGSRQSADSLVAWKRTLYAHKGTLLVIAEREGGEVAITLDTLLRHIDEALAEGSTTTDTQGHALADAVMEWIDREAAQGA